MKTEIDFQSTNRFEMSLGFVLVTISIILGYLFFNSFVNFLLDINSIVKLLTSLLFFIFFGIYFMQGIQLVKKGYDGLKEFEGLDKKLRFEQMVNQILEQDLKLIDIKLRQLEYNEKVRSLKEIDKGRALGLKTLEEVQYRDIQNVVAQALDQNFYENTYSDIIKKVPKMQKSEMSSLNGWLKSRLLSKPITLIGLTLGFLGVILLAFSVKIADPGIPPALDHINIIQGYFYLGVVLLAGGFVMQAVGILREK